MSNFNFWPKKWLRPQWSLTKEFSKRYLTVKQNGYLLSGCLREVVAYEKWTLGETELIVWFVVLFGKKKKRRLI